MATQNKGLDVKMVAGAVFGALDSIGNVEMGGIKLNQPSRELLDLNAMSLDVHVAMHPACVAYYGALRKEAARSLATLKRSYDRWYKKMWTEAKVKACGGAAQYKPTVNDVEARLIVDHEKELEDWDERLDGAQEHLDTLESWFEAWRQKSFAMRDEAFADKEERYASGGGTVTSQGATLDRGGDLGSEKIRRVKDIIRKRREASGGVSA